MQPMRLKTAVERFRIPFALSLSKGGRDFEPYHPMGECRKAVHAFRYLRTDFDSAQPERLSAFQLPILGCTAG